MPHSWDPEFATAAGPILEAVGAAPKIAVHDVTTRRQAFPALFTALAAAFEPPPGVEHKQLSVKAADGYDIPVVHFFPTKPKDGKPTAAVVHFHGGGLIMGDVAMMVPGLLTQVAATGVPVFSVEYRLAPEFKHPIPVTDAYTALRWVQEHAAEFNIDPARLAVMGESAGGCIAAGVALLARDKGLPGPPLAKQILVYPMIDNETTKSDKDVAPFLIWSGDDNVTGWTALLDQADTSSVSLQYAAAARATDVAGLPPTYIDVGTLDLFRDEDILYAQRLLKAGVPTELHVYPGVPHAFELLAKDSSITKTASANRLKAISTL